MTYNLPLCVACVNKQLRTMFGPDSPDTVLAYVKAALAKETDCGDDNTQNKLKEKYIDKVKS